MKDATEKLFEDIEKVLTKLGNMIVWIAQRTLTNKEFREFCDKFVEPIKDGEQE